MQTFGRKPPPPLDLFIETIWFQQGQQAQPHRERVLPDGSVEIVLNLNEGPLTLFDETAQQAIRFNSGAIISGPYSKPFAIEIFGRINLLGIHFRPGGAYALLGIPTYTLFNQTVPLREVWGAFSAELHASLANSSSIDQQFDRLCAALLGRLQQSPQPHRVVTTAIHNMTVRDGVLLKNLSAELGLSQRRFIDLFKRDVGLTPKRFFRVQRFQQVLRQLYDEADRPDWVDTALQAGYYDQAHFIHDFQAFSGLKPTLYHAQNLRHYNHIVIQP